MYNFFFFFFFEIAFATRKTFVNSLILKTMSIGKRGKEVYQRGTLLGFRLEVLTCPNTSTKPEVLKEDEKDSRH